MPSHNIVFAAPRDVRFEPQQRPMPSARQVLVRTEHTLVSPGTEMAMYEGTHSALNDPDNSFAKYPHRPGYTAIGRVEAKGESVTELKLGDRIFFLGTHSTWTLMNPEEAIWLPVPDGAPIEKVLLARLVQISATAFYCLRRHPANAIILGAGLIGIFSAQVMQVQGVRKVVVQDVNAKRLELARRLGISSCVLATGFDLRPSLLELGFEPDVIVEATGVPQLIPPALEAVRRLGDVVLLGSPRGNVEIDPYKLVHRKGAALIGAHEAIYPDRAPPPQLSRQALLKQALKWTIDGAVKLDGLITHTIKAEDLPQFYETVSKDKNNVLGVVVNWD
jgi:2-desacetyl-2-hydroxyethyl bacteriochlorophyllide A dehydrogenase